MPQSTEDHLTPALSTSTDTASHAATAASRELTAQVASLSESLSQAQAALASAQTRHDIDLALLRAGVIDLEAGRLLTQAALAQASDGNHASAVERVRRGKPFLFRAASTGSVMAPVREGEEVSPDALARRAAATGDRRALLHYLRHRRGV